MSKPKTFVVYYANTVGWRLYEGVPIVQAEQSFTVIEKSAYDELQAQLAKAKAALEEIVQRTHFDKAEGPELRAQNAANYRCATAALAELKLEKK